MDVCKCVNSNLNTHQRGLYRLHQGSKEANVSVTNRLISVAVVRLLMTETTATEHFTARLVVAPHAAYRLSVEFWICLVVTVIGATAADRRARE